MRGGVVMGLVACVVASHALGGSHADRSRARDAGVAGGDWRAKACGNLSDWVCGSPADVDRYQKEKAENRKRTLRRFLKESGVAEGELTDAFAYLTSCPTMLLPDDVDEKGRRTWKPAPCPESPRKKSFTNLLREYFTWLGKTVSTDHLKPLLIATLTRAVRDLTTASDAEKEMMLKEVQSAGVSFVPPVPREDDKFLWDFAWFAKDCGANGLLAGAANSFGFLKVCPGFYLSEAGPDATPDEVTAAVFLPLAHEFGHSFDANHSGVGRLHPENEACFGEALENAAVQSPYPQFMNELAADSVGMAAFTKLLETRNADAAESARLTRSTLRTLCTNNAPDLESKDPHPPPRLRIDLLGRHPALRKRLGCRGEGEPYCGLL